ncbi:hypothetical protein EDD37DRAFT_304944 [Exophiala viscosa]|uniref:uncharacterized protein n=1 Tax=Exophiala viscosa TaxID=2486360 RepID=UPI0021994F0D|nr:hypothetical protein EDD37DRAFT_304944 [Exophiala viscosa]
MEEGQAQDYRGVSIHPRHISGFEKTVLKRHLNYNPELDRQSKVQELRNLYNKVEGNKALESDDEKTLKGNSDMIPDNVSKYFEMEKTRAPSQHRAT